ncbi:DsbA family oxidoreductase [Pseudoxanthomonas koreensis]|uniref:DsbA family oxidoreductase n=1 Tax=Pseudoxanthomonas koreensis TaxID=266061 RepID=UPI001391E1DF|nr:DsbA family oxidoreductase [Pseudoxanthomonas koreensis]KAF1697680.1 disulfide bond formation protein DsbA [Pseudoxanthomonas koreensis]
MSGGNRLTIGIDFDLVCPWCFIGKRQLDRARDQFARQHPEVDVVAVWHPVQLLPDVPKQGLPFAEFYERRLGSPEAVRQRQQQVVRAARGAGLDIDLARIERMPNTGRAHGLLRRVARLGEPDLHEALLERLFAAYFQRGEDIGDAATLLRLAGEVGVPVDRIADAAPGAAVAPAGRAATGVPHFVFNQRLALSGAQDAAILVAAMRRAILVPAPPAAA